MKKRNLILLPLLVLGSTGLSSLVTSCSKLPESVEFATDEAVVVRVGQPVELPGVTVLPEKAEDKTYSFALSSEGIVTLEEDEGKYILTGVAPGEVVITVTSTANPELKDTILVTVPTPDPLPTPVVKTIAELNAMAKSDYEHLYKVTGVVSSIGKSNSGTHDEYGNMYLSSEDGTDSIMVYGACSDKSCLDWKDYNYTSISFKNKKDMIKSGLSAKIGYGDLITMIVQFQDYNGTKEILGYVIEESIVKSSTRPNYTASVEVTQVGGLGGATLSKTESICVGEELTVNLDTPVGYEPLVKVNDVELVPSEGVYKFTALLINRVTVSFVEAVAPQGDVEYVLDELFANVGSSYVSNSAISEGNTFTASYSCYNGTGKAGDGVWEGKKHLVIGANATNDKNASTTYFTISTKYAIDGVTLNGLSWCGSNLKIVVEYYDAATEQWVADGAEQTFASTKKIKFQLKSTGTWTSSQVRFKLTTTYEGNDRVGVESVVLHYPTAE